MWYFERRTSMQIAKRSILAACCVFASLIGLAAAPVARSAPQADQTCAPGGCRVGLPIVMRTAAPDLAAPENGVVTVSLAPTLSWTPLITGTYLLQVSTNPAFDPGVATLDISDTVKITSFQQFYYTPTSNLSSVTTFYWRVGAPQSQGYAFSQIRSFTTPVKNNNLLPKPVQLIAPADHATLPSTDVTLIWQPVPGAIEYRVRTYDANNVLFNPATDDLPGSTNTLSASGLTPGMTYNWKVRALNQYGWGPYSAIHYFTVP
jgi:hypothetical protein